MLQLHTQWQKEFPTRDGLLHAVCMLLCVVKVKVKVLLGYIPN